MATRPVSALITGANRGLGLEMVKQMVEAPHPVRKLFACCRDPDGPRAEALRTLAKKHPNIICVIRLGASSAPQLYDVEPSVLLPCTDVHWPGLNGIKQSAQQVGALVGTGGLNLLINNAGIPAQGTVQDTNPEDMQKSFNTNLMGPMNLIKEFLPQLRAAAKASELPGMSCSKAAVVNISSFLGSLESVKHSYAYFQVVPYRISKAGLNMLTLCAAEELKKDEILFSLLHPGYVRTDMTGEAGEIDAEESVQGMFSVMASLTEKQNGAFLDYKGKSVPW